MSTLLNLKGFLLAEGIQVCDKKLLKGDEKNKIDACEQLKLIYEVHEKLKGREDIYFLSLHSEIGKVIEEHKIRNKRLERYLRQIVDCKNKTTIEEFIESTGEEVLNRGEECIKSIYSNGYIDIIKRSMKKNEICIGKCFNNNLWYDNGYKINDDSKICFNLVESDCAYYLSKLKRMGSNENWDELIDYYVGIECLDKNSKAFIRALISYPIEYMKTFEKLVYMKKSVDSKLTINKFQDSLKRDGKSLMLK